MDFDFSPEQKLLKEEARKFLETHASSKQVRQVLDGPEPFHRELWEGVCRLGWAGTAIPEVYGGQGAGYLELCVLAGELGRAVAPIPFASSIYLAAEALLLAGSEEQKRRWLPGLANGETIGTLALAEEGGNGTVKGVRASVESGRLSGTKWPVPDGDVAHLSVVVARSATDRPASLFLVPLEEGAVVRESIETIDPTRSQAKLSFENAVAEPLGNEGDGERLLSRLFDRAAVLLAFEQLEGAQRALEMARDYALGRYAFGRPIGSFQAIKHMLADMYVSAELARSNCYWGAWALSSDAPKLPEAAASARVSATQAFQHCAKNNIQVHGGMGFTWEFDCHLYYRRAASLSLALGSLSRWKDLLVTRLQDARAS